MAKVKVYDIGSTSFSVKLTGLQVGESQGIDYKRRCHWVVYYNKEVQKTEDVTIEKDHTSSEGAYWTVTGMVAGRTYEVYCDVYGDYDHDDDEDYIVTLGSGPFTLDPISTYNIYCYGNDEYISNTTVTLDGHTQYSCEYGNTLNLENQSASSISFYASASSDGSFVHWVYTIDGKQNTSNSNPFIYAGGQDIHIRAVGQSKSGSEGSQEWILKERPSLRITKSGKYDFDGFNVEPYTLYRMAVIFSSSNSDQLEEVYSILKIKSQFNNLRVYVTQTTNWKANTGIPTGVGDWYNENGEGINAYFTTYVSSQTYYIWIRTQEPGASGLINDTDTHYINVDFEYKWIQKDIYLGNLQENLSRTIDLQVCTIYQFKFSCNKSGKATFYTTGNIQTMGYLTSLDGWTRREGSGVVRAGSADVYVSRSGTSDSPNFKISYDNIVAGTQYYIWIRADDGETTGRTTLHITIPQDITQWTWSDTALNAFQNHGYTTALTVDEWNEFVEFVATKTGYNLQGALMTAEDNMMTASRFNHIRNAIGSLNTFREGQNSIREYIETRNAIEGADDWDMRKGEVVKGQYFIDLAEYANQIE